MTEQEILASTYPRPVYYEWVRLRESAFWALEDFPELHPDDDLPDAEYSDQLALVVDRVLLQRFICN